MATKKKSLSKAQSDGFYMTADSATTNKALKSDPGFYVTPPDSLMKKYTPKTSKNGYELYKKGGSIKSKSKKK